MWLRWKTVQKRGDPIRLRWSAITLEPRIDHLIPYANSAGHFSASRVAEPEKLAKSLDNRINLLGLLL